MPNSDISLENLTKKLAVLLALCTGQRVQTLSSIETLNIVTIGDRIEIKIPKRLKTSGKNKPQPTLILPFYHHEEAICPARTLQHYLQETKTIRACTENLFITYKKPIRNATAQTISRWIKTMLEKSGVDTNRYTAHSTRHASASAAARKGFSYDTIRTAAGWTKKSQVFANFYQRPLVSNEVFANAVLDNTH
nr:unnamed protein product [Callosobruchus analis]